MTKQTFKIGYDSETQMEYIYKAQDELTKNHRETDNPIVTGFMPAILTPSGNPHPSCPVTSFKLYIDHLNDKLNWLWQTPNPAAYERGDHIWFKNCRIGENTIGSFMSTLSSLVGLSYRYTNHCVRVTGTTNLTRANFTSNQIMSITGHKSVNSLAMYQRVNSNEKLMMGMSLAFNLFRPALVQAQMNGFSKAQCKEIKKGKRKALPSATTTTPPLKPQKSPIQLPQPEAPMTPQIPPKTSEMALVPVDNNPINTPDFDILDFINDNDDEDILMAATQMERQLQNTTQVVTSTTSTTLIKKSPTKSSTMPTFMGCKIENIHFHIHKN